MAASMREALDNAIKEAETQDAAASNAPASTETATPSDAASTDLAAASSVEADEPVSETPDGEASEPTAEPEKVATEAIKNEPVSPPAKPNRVDRAPVSWKGGPKGEWANVPLAVRQEVHRREMQIEQALREVAPVKQFHQQFQQVIGPYQARINSFANSPIEAVNNLLQVDYQLSSAPKVQRAQLMARLIKDYEVDISELDNALAGVAPSQQAIQQQDIDQLINQRVQQAIAPIFQQREQAAQQQAAHTVESMAQDPKFPYFNEVREDMADLIEAKARRGIDMSLEQAYALATKINPDVSSQMERQTTISSASQQHQQAMRAKNAASSVSGAPASGGMQTFAGNGDLRSTIAAAFNGARI